MTTRFAPAPGTDPEFEKIIEDVNQALASDPAAAEIDDDTRRQVIARNLAKYGKKTYVPGPDEDEEMVEESAPIFDRADSFLAPDERTLRVPPMPEKPYWYEDPADAELVDWFITARREVGHRMQGGLLITGPAGTGKTRGVVNAVERYNERHGTNIPLLVMNCPTITDETKWFGRREVDPDKGTFYVKSDFITAVENGSIILLDEFMRLHPRIHNPVMSLVDTTESVLLSELNLLVKRHPQTVFIGTTNIGSQFGGTHRMDWAMRERWSYTLERDFPPEDEEIKILSTNNPGCDEDAAAVLVAIAQKSRQMWMTGDLRSPISTRTLDNAAFLVASGFTEREALTRTVIPEYDPGSEGTATDESERAKIAHAIDLKLGKA